MLGLAFKHFGSCGLGNLGFENLSLPGKGVMSYGDDNDTKGILVTPTPQKLGPYDHHMIVIGS